MKRILSIVALLLAGSYGLALADDVVVADSVNVEDLDTEEVDDLEEAVAQDTLTVEGLNLVEEIVSDSVKQKQPRGIYGSGVANTWELQTEIVYNTSFAKDEIKDGDDSGGIQFTLGYNFNEHFLLGATLGYIHDFGGMTSFEAGTCAPVLAAFQFRWNTFPRVQFFAEGRAGMMMSVKSDYKFLRWDKNHEVEKATLKYPNYQYYELNGGIMWHMSERYDVRLSAGYAYAKPGKEQEEYKYNTYEEHILSIKVGLARRF